MLILILFSNESEDGPVKDYTRDEQHRHLVSKPLSIVVKHPIEYKDRRTLQKMAAGLKPKRKYTKSEKFLRRNMPKSKVSSEPEVEEEEQDEDEEQ